MTKSAPLFAKHQFISISQNRAFGISRAFCEAYALDQYSYAILYFDQSKKRIAIRFDDTYKAGSFTLHKMSLGGVNIRALGFFSKYGIDAKEYAGRYKAHQHPSRSLGIDEPGNSLVIKLRGR